MKMQIFLWIKVAFTLLMIRRYKKGKMQILLWIIAAFNLLVISKRLCLEWAMLKQEPKSLVTPDTSKEDLNYPQEPDRRPWSDLPFPLLEQIADRLAMLELLSFQGTCKDWRHASKASAHHYQTESCATSTTTTYQEQPWFLLYSKGEYPNCVFYDPYSKNIYTKFNIPELEEGVECLASKGGWLLLYRNSDRSMFFFCPFSRARIDLPKLPKVGSESLLFNRIATFSSPPTSADCIVCVGTETWHCPQTIESRANFAVIFLRRGANEWHDQHEYYRSYLPTCSLDVARIGTFFRGRIYFFCSYMRGVSFSLETKEWDDRAIVADCLNRVTAVKRGYFSCNKGLDKGKLGLKDIDSLSICGTELRGNHRNSKDNITLILKEDIKGDPIDNVQGIMKLLGRGKPKSIIRKHYKAVWIHSRFFQLPPKYSCIFERPMKMLICWMILLRGMMCPAV